MPSAMLGDKQPSPLIDIIIIDIISTIFFFFSGNEN